MSLRRLPDNPEWDNKQLIPCMSPGHEVPHNMTLEPGRWEWTCNACGKKTVFEIPRVYYSSVDGSKE